MRRFYRALFNRELDNVYFANVLYSFHTYLLLYVNSPFLARVMSDNAIAMLYIVASVVNIFLMINTPRIIAAMGIRKFSSAVIALETVSALGLIVVTNVWSIGLFFIAYQALIVVFSYLLDLFLERATRNELYTGRIRSIFLTISNVVLVISPLIVSVIVARTGSFVPVYAAAIVLNIPMLLIIMLDLPKNGIGDKHLSVARSFKGLWRTLHLRGVTLSRLALEFFYGWMVIYMSLYLHEIIGFSWSDIALLFSIMLVPFVLFELPVGNISDKHANEKEIMIIGVGIIAVSVACIPTLHTADFLAWAVLLFATRVGASFVEMATESYFFKHVSARDTSVVCLFRLTRSIGFILAAVVVTGLFAIMSFGESFFVLAVISLFGLIPTLWLTEKK